MLAYLDYEEKQTNSNKVLNFRAANKLLPAILLKIYPALPLQIERQAISQNHPKREDYRCPRDSFPFLRYHLRVLPHRIKLLAQLALWIHERVSFRRLV